MADVEQMVERQRVLADFGDFAIRSEDLDEVLTEACRLVGRALNTALSKVLEITDDGASLLMRAGVGWRPGLVGELRLPMNERSSEQYSISIGEPVCTPDIDREDRFDFPPFMKEAGVVGIVNVPIFLPGGAPYGLLQVDSRKAWSPDAETTQFLRTYTTILGPVIDRLHKVHELRESERRNETLLRELQHRIKNNIGAIKSLVRMRMDRARSDEARDELKLVGDRVEALRLVHEQVYAANGGDRLPLRDYVTQLLRGLLALHREAAVRLNLRIEEVDVASDTAIPLGLILNEFTTNSLKYAFNGRAGVIAVKAEARDGRLRICISDNGRGLPAESEPGAGAKRPGSGTGMALIEGLARQIGAKPAWRSDGGTRLELEFRRR